MTMMNKTKMLRVAIKIVLRREKVKALMMAVRMGIKRKRKRNRSETNR